MGKQSQKKSEGRGAPEAGPARYPRPPRGGQGLAVSTLIAVAGVLAISVANWREIGRIEKSLDGRLDEIDNGLTALSTKVDNLPKPTAQPAARRGPDPNRVYAIDTTGAPSKGPAGAPITIAEFSDFQ